MKDKSIVFKSYKKPKIKNIRKIRYNSYDNRPLLDESIRIGSNKYSYRKIFNKNKSIIKHKNIPRKLFIFFNIISILLFITSYYLYYLSLEKCLDGIDKCGARWDWIKTKIKQLVISGILIIFLINLMALKIISKLHLIHFVITFFYFYYYSHSTNFDDHGGYNIIGLFIALFISLIFIIILKISPLLFKKQSKCKKLIYIITLILLFLISIDKSHISSSHFPKLFISKDPINCDDWAKGLNDTYIENDVNKYGCQIQFPKRCEYKILGSSQDLSRIMKVNCSNKKKNSRRAILRHSSSPYIYHNTMKFGFPLTNKDEGKIDKKDDVVLKTYTFRNLLDMDKPLPPGFFMPEYIVDFSKDPSGELLINLNYNETLSTERKQFEKNSNPYSDNIMILYIDSISRANSLRKLKKTLNFFEQFISYKGNHNKQYPNENFHSFQFFKYHSFESYTAGNLIQLFYGNLRNVTDLVRINKYAKINGYITCYSTDYCKKDSARTLHNLTNDELYDHQLLICDPNTANFNSATKRCLYGNLNTYYLYDYINQFWRKYPNNRKFAATVVNDAHEGTLELIKYSDDVIYNCLNSLYNDNLLKDTTIFLMSDHGCFMPSIYYLNKFYKLEYRLPMLYMIINDRKNVDYNQQYFNIHKNQQTLITGYDIYNTIANVIFGDSYANIPNKENTHDTPKSPIGQSLFEKINQKERNPKNYTNMATNVCI